MERPERLSRAPALDPSGCYCFTITFGSAPALLVELRSHRSEI